MNHLEGLRVVVAGAGAVGSVTALTLLRCGASVLLVDSAPQGDNASGVAAGMLAPAFEALLDPVSTDHFPWLAVACDAWTGLAASLQSPQAAIDRSGALFIPADEADLQAKAERLLAFDPERQILTPAQAMALTPGLSLSRPALFTACDWRLEPGPMLGALRGAFLAEGGEQLQDAVLGWAEGTLRLASSGARRADALVLATGAASPPWDIAELGLLTPIKGQILRFEGQGPLSGPVVRAAGVYVAPSLRGAVVGATMQAGRRDRGIEPEAVAELHEAAGGLFAALALADPQASAGVRAATPALA